MVNRRGGVRVVGAPVAARRSSMAGSAAARTVRPVPVRQARPARRDARRRRKRGYRPRPLRARVILMVWAALAIGIWSQLLKAEQPARDRASCPVVSTAAAPETLVSYGVLESVM